MSRVSNFVLPIIAGVGAYFLISILFPNLYQILVLLIALAIAYALRWTLGWLQTQTSTGAQKRK